VSGLLARLLGLIWTKRLHHYPALPEHKLAAVCWAGRRFFVPFGDECRIVATINSNSQIFT
jgi:hypothetical protein